MPIPTQPPVIDPVPAQPVAEDLTEQEIKEAIKNLKPIAAFDPDIQKEIETLKQRLKNLKKKKS